VLLGDIPDGEQERVAIVIRISSADFLRAHNRKPVDRMKCLHGV
jgi:hypothetical protein